MKKTISKKMLSSMKAYHLLVLIRQGNTENIIQGAINIVLTRKEELLSDDLFELYTIIKKRIWERNSNPETEQDIKERKIIIDLEKLLIENKHTTGKQLSDIILFGSNEIMAIKAQNALIKKSDALVYMSELRWDSQFEKADKERRLYFLENYQRINAHTMYLLVDDPDLTIREKAKPLFLKHDRVWDSSFLDVMNRSKDKGFNKEIRKRIKKIKELFPYFISRSF